MDDKNFDVIYMPIGAGPDGIQQDYLRIVVPKNKKKNQNQNRICKN